MWLRDVLDFLCHQKLRELTDFEWQQFLRLYIKENPSKTFFNAHTYTYTYDIVIIFCLVFTFMYIPIICSYAVVSFLTIWIYVFSIYFIPYICI